MENSPYCEADVVDTYDRVSVPLQFAAPARDLVAALRLRHGDRVLDVGTGTGIAAIAAAADVGSAGLVVGIDPSLPMLGRLRSEGTVHAAAARAPDLPFGDSCFDAVTANFVLTHMKDVPSGLRDMVRLLRPGGRLGVTCWGAGAGPVAQLWSDVVTRFTSADELKRAFQMVIPGEGSFADAGHLRRSLQAAGLENVDVSHREYPVTAAIVEYLSMKLAGVEGILLRRRLNERHWARFQQHLADRFRDRFGESVTYVRNVHIGVGTTRVG